MRFRRDDPDPVMDEFFETLYALSDGYLGLRGATDQVLGGPRRARLLIRGVYTVESGVPRIATIPVLPNYSCPGNSERSGLEQGIDLPTTTLVMTTERLRVSITLVAGRRGVMVSRAQVLGEPDAALAMSFPDTAEVEAAGLEDVVASEDGWSARSRTGQWVACLYRVTASRSMVVGAVGVGSDRHSALALSAQRLQRFHEGDLTDSDRWWHERWREVPLEVDGSDSFAAGVRYGMLHLIQAPDRHAERHNIAPRGLTSGYFDGHFYFNTDLFMVPFYALTEPALARSLLRDRVAHLPQAMRFAQESGLSGARYPLVVGPDGAPAPSATEPGRQLRDQAHFMSACVLYGLWRYLAATGDEGFLTGSVKQMVSHIAGYYVACVREGTLRQVSGFDEHHFGVADHWATNFLARWALRAAAELVAGPDADSWRDAADEVHLPPAVDGGVLPQFSGYLDLPDLGRPETSARRRAGGAATTQREVIAPHTRSIKQADIIQLMAMFPDAFGSSSHAANLDFYEPRTQHISSLSLPAHATVAAWLRRPHAADYLHAGLRHNLDFQPRRGFRNGVHLAAYAGAWLSIVDGFLNLRGQGDVLTLRPWWPVELPPTTIRLWWRSRRLHFRLTHSQCEIHLAAGSDVAVEIDGRRTLLDSGQKVSVPSGKEPPRP